MTLADAFDFDGNRRRQGAFCTMGQLLETLNEQDRQTLVDVMNDPTWTSTRISDVLKTDQAGGHAIGPHVISRHRSRRCQC
jgi:hypothetical protein